MLSSRNYSDRSDPSYGTDFPIFDAGGHCALDRVEHWLVNAGIQYWPRTPSGAISMKRDSFRLMCTHPRRRGDQRAQGQFAGYHVGQASDRSRRPQPAQHLPVRDRHRPQCALQEFVQRPRRHAQFYGGASRQIFSSIWTGGLRRWLSPPPCPGIKH